MNTVIEYDVIIVGGGMVGSLLAAALVNQDFVGTPLKIAVLEGVEPLPFIPGSQPSYDIRVSALSVASQSMLENLGAWQGIVQRRACPYREMLVWDGEAHGRTHFRASDINAPVLGHIVENRVIQLALLDLLANNSQVDYRCPAKLLSYDDYNDHVSCRLEGVAEPITTKLLVGADGARSSVRRLAGIDVQSSAYPHHALVATVETNLPQQDITWQRFKPTGPEAFLPLCGSRASMVWYHDQEEIEHLKSLSEHAFIESMEQTFPTELGGVKRVFERGSFPIVKAHATRYLANRCVLIGDAAHTVHPLAGQGVNIGLLDAASLADVLVDAIDKQQDIGSRRVLRRYERWRKGENSMMIGILDGFYHAFKPQPDPLKRLRSSVLNMADSIDLIKQTAMARAMGNFWQLAFACSF